VAETATKTRRKLGRPSTKKTPEKEVTPDISLPDGFLGKNGSVGAKRLSKGTFQKKVMALFAPYLLPDALNALRRSIKDSDSLPAIRVALESFGVIQPARGAGNVFAPSVNVQTSAQALAASKAAALPSPRTPEGIRDFEDITQLFENDHKLIEERNRSFDITPEGAAGE